MVNTKWYEVQKKLGSPAVSNSFWTESYSPDISLLMCHKGLKRPVQFQSTG